MNPKDKIDKIKMLMKEICPEFMRTGRCGVWCTFRKSLKDQNAGCLLYSILEQNHRGKTQ